MLVRGKFAYFPSNVCGYRWFWFDHCLLLLQAGSTLYAQLEIWRTSQGPDHHQLSASPIPTPAGLPSADDMSDGAYLNFTAM